MLAAHPNYLDEVKFFRYVNVWKMDEVERSGYY